MITYLKSIHALYNILILFFFVYQLSLGLQIRRGRKTGVLPLQAIKSHRKFGPVLAFMGIAGFFAGMLVMFIDKGHLLKYPLHFYNGMAISLAIAALYFISGKIRASGAEWRNLHFSGGIALIGLYLSQVLMGLVILM
ncbi:MAG: DUF4079 family protein [Nitrospirae bacterium]|nr:DUF4079 family protein [Nitrospirota bacterium]